MRISLDAALARLPPPAAATWPQGVWDVEVLKRGSMSVELFTPRGSDYQTSHTQDELYVVLKGSGALVIKDATHEFSAGDALFVAAGARHRFEHFTPDLVTWAIFWGRWAAKRAERPMAWAV
jgi:mannose-6-phosphate isomerase-like protein (cupin superfamily)